MKARYFIHSTLSLEYEPVDEPSEPQLAFHHLQAKVAETIEALRVATADVGTLQALLDTERQGCTSSPSMERELVSLQNLYGQLREIAKDLSFDAVGFLRTHSSVDLILLTDFGRLCRVVLDHLSHI